MELTFNIYENKTLNVKIAIDKYRGIIHILDLNQGTIDVVHAFKDIQEKILRYCGLQQNKNWSWFLYKNNGTVSKANNDFFDYMPLSDERVYPAFIGEMLKRENKRLLDSSKQCQTNEVAI